MKNKVLDAWLDGLLNSLRLPRACKARNDRKESLARQLVADQKLYFGYHRGALSSQLGTVVHGL